MSALRLKLDISADEFLAHLTEAVYRIALHHHFQKTFIDVALELQQVLREVIRQDMAVIDACGLHAVCQEATEYEPWSEIAERIYEELDP